MLLVVRMFRRLIRLLMTQRPRLSAPESLVRALLLVPVFGTLLVLLRLRAMILGPLRLEAVTRDGLRFRCALPDLIQMYLALFGVWEPDLTSFIESRLREGDGFIDVGANVGWFSIIAAKRVGETGQVVALEPSGAIHSALISNAKSNGVEGRIRAVRAAASDEQGMFMLHVGPAWNVGLSSVVARKGLRAEAAVAGAPLGELLDADEISRARIIKIDVEGGEDRVLRGMIGLLPRLRVDAEIVVELSPRWWPDVRQTPAEVLRRFTEAGFHVYEVANNYWPWRYLWPNRVSRPRRFRGRLDQRVRRLDLVLSRIDADAL